MDKTNPRNTYSAALVLREDGYPADARIRSTVLRVRLVMQRQPGRIEYEHSLVGLLRREHLRSTGVSRSYSHGRDKVSAWWPEEGEIIEALLARGILEEPPTSVKEFRTFRFAEKRLDPTSPEAKQSNYEAMLQATADRVCDGPDARVRMLELITRARALYTATWVAVGEHRALAIPQELGLSASGPFVSKAVLFVDGIGGITVCKAAGNAISTSWSETEATVSFDAAAIELDQDLTDRLSCSRLLPGKEICTVVLDAASKAVKAMSFLNGKRELVSSIVGEELDAQRWLSLLASVRRVRLLATPFSRKLFGGLDVATRRSALRDPKATYKLYNWFRCGDAACRERRVQASLALPFLTRWLPSIGDVIDAGDELLPAAGQVVGMTVPQLRRYSGMQWQKLGGAFRNLSSIVEERKTFFDGVPAEKMPMTRAEWIAANTISDAAIFVSQASLGIRQAFGRAMSRDWLGYARLAEADVFHAIDDTAQLLAPLLTGRLNSAPEPCHHIAAVLFSMIGGDSFGLKRLARFNKEWHARQPLRAAAYRALRREAFGDQASSWKSLTKGDFECDHGTMTWLLNEDELVDEGMLMHHCVGSYAEHCISGRSHIAAVYGKDGSRSTVEFRLAGTGPAPGSIGSGMKGVLTVIQNRARYNGEPGAGAADVVGAFMARNKSRKFSMKQRGKPRLEAKTMKCTEATEEFKDRIRLIFSDLLPKEILAWSSQRWQEAVCENFVPIKPPMAVTAPVEIGGEFGWAAAA